MSERAARIRLQLNSGGLLAGLSQIGDTVDGLGRRIGKALDKPVREGLSAMKGSISSLKGEMSNAVGMAASLGGAFTVGSAVKEALDLEQGYRNIAFAIRAGKGEAMEWADVQKIVESASDKWSRSNTEMSASFKALYDDVGDIDFAADAIHAIGAAAAASGEEVGTLTNLAGQLNEKFGIGSDEIEDALASVVAIGNKGGIGLADIGEKIGMIGASAKLMGLQGQEGVQFALGMFNIADGATGSMKKATAAVTQLLDEFANTDKLKAIEKEFNKDWQAPRLKLTSKDGSADPAAIEKILQRTGGKKELLAKVFTGESLKLMTEFGKVYERTFTEVEGNTKQKSNAAIEAFRAAVAEAGKQTLNSADLQEEAAKRMGDPQAQMRKALNELQSEFTRPEMLKALREMAEVAPKVAHGLAKVIEFAVDNPLLAGAGYVGGRAALAGGSTFAVELSKKGLSAAGESIAGAFHKSMESSGGGVKGVGSIIGQAAGVAMVSYAAYELGKQMIDAALAADEAVKSKNEQGTALAEATIGTGNKEAMQEQLSALKVQLAGQESDVKNKGLADWVANTATKGAEAIGLVDEHDSYNARNRKELGVERTKETIRELEEAINATEVGDATRSLVSSVNVAARELKKLVPPQTNGLPPPGGNNPGHQ